MTLRLRKTSLWIALLASLLAWRTAAAAEQATLDLQECFGKPSQWSVSARQFLAEADGYGFRKNSTRGDSVAAVPLKIRDVRTGQSFDYRPHISFLGLPLSDAEIRYSLKTGHPLKVSATFYNRGDDSGSPLGENGFIALRNQVGAAITALIKQKPAPKSADVKDLDIDRECYLWRTDRLSYILESSITRRPGAAARPEYLKIVLVPPSSLDAVLADYTQPARRLTPAQLREQVRQNRQGEAWIDAIPMVNQGGKGYCSCAVVARLLQYYGRRNTTMHDVAQATDTDPRTGTELNAMLAALRRLAPVLKISVKTYPDYCVIEPRGMTKYLHDYNAAARAAGIPNIDLERMHGAIDFGTLQERLDRQALRAARTTPANLKEFRKIVADSIDAGVPLVWGVTLGMVREPAASPQNEGGHMRLIIGYNRTRDEILFSDSWGEGHEKKTMSSADALFITSNLLAILPY